MTSVSAWFLSRVLLLIAKRFACVAFTHDELGKIASLAGDIEAICEAAQAREESEQS